jgi:hypothetical protein
VAAGTKVKEAVLAMLALIVRGLLFGILDCWSGQQTAFLPVGPNRPIWGLVTIGRWLAPWTGNSVQAVGQLPESVTMGIGMASQRALSCHYGQ